VLPRACYVHLPFCRRRCHYCDFPIQVVGSASGAADAPAERYCNLLQREIRATRLAGDDGSTKRGALRSLYFGGGTPSLTPPALFAGIVDALRERYGLAADCEVTLEMDPGTFDEARLQAFLAAGVTRVSLGVQSFDTALLQTAGRSHDAATAEAAIRLLLDAAAAPQTPLRSISIDLIGGLPGQTRESWRRSLEAAVGCGAHHVSVYDLQIEPRTAFGRWFEAGKLEALPAEEEAAVFFRDATSVLGANGLERYEVSSFARPGHRSQHNAAYWRNEPFWGFGLGATSHLNNVRLARPRKYAEYERFVKRLEVGEERGQCEERHPIGGGLTTGGALACSDGFEAEQAAHGELEVGRDALTTLMMLQLRTLEGCAFDELAERFGDHLGRVAAAACADAAAELPAEWVLHDEGRRLALTDPEGFLFSNDAIATVFARLDDRLEEKAD
jgi:putative oxygen-independent coproporphyrinogen III oxidase